MRSDLVLFRTPKGEEILLSHGHEISVNQRRALLAIDGKTTVADLAKKVFWVSDVISVLDGLYAKGFIHDDISMIPAVASQAGGAGILLKLQLAGIAKELLGNNAERIIKKLEDADGTPESLEQALLGCKKLIKLTISEEMADTFLQRTLQLIGK
ncbi:MAG: hypothetical protein AWT59_0934 [Candidatus Gallionella acididurans]|uniref:Uncharacterized protein n=1 Tax=Candidatus Gallionella acididurans TaxID=1796491 RepID=A0A139BW40_9PROT|nr:MAG: hypothetical protein AWT59_0934 [Candidatus Gallionella acididurans]